MREKKEFWGVEIKPEGSACSSHLRTTVRTTMKKMVFSKGQGIKLKIKLKTETDAGSSSSSCARMYVPVSSTLLATAAWMLDLL